MTVPAAAAPTAAAASAGTSAAPRPLCPCLCAPRSQIECPPGARLTAEAGHPQQRSFTGSITYRSPGSAGCVRTSPGRGTVLRGTRQVDLNLIGQPLGAKIHLHRYPLRCQRLERPLDLSPTFRAVHQMQAPEQEARADRCRPQNDRGYAGALRPVVEALNSCVHFLHDAHELSIARVRGELLGHLTRLREAVELGEAAVNAFARLGVVGHKKNGIRWPERPAAVFDNAHVGRSHIHVYSWHPQSVSATAKWVRVSDNAIDNRR